VSVTYGHNRPITAKTKTEQDRRTKKEHIENMKREQKRTEKISNKDKK
jgi:hypothetical protein